jgi:putative phosphoribosyl transferase
MEANEIKIPVGRHSAIHANLTIPFGSKSVVLFSHGSGSSRFSKRNNFVSRELNQRNIATLLLDLLTEDEDRSYENRFNIELLSSRLVTATSFMNELPELKNSILGYFGASTGAASALQAAANLNGIVHAVVSRGGRPDLAAASLGRVTAPTLLIVGGLDDQVIELNRQAYSRLNCEKKIEIIEGASHLFEEHGKLEVVAGMAADWFTKHLQFDLHQHEITTVKH